AQPRAGAGNRGWQIGSRARGACGRNRCRRRPVRFWVRGGKSAGPPPRCRDHCPDDLEDDRKHVHPSYEGWRAPPTRVRSTCVFARGCRAAACREARSSQDARHLENWGRPDDTVGIAGIVNGISGVHQAFFDAGGLGILIGDDGQPPNPGLEKIFETYYSSALSPEMRVSFDFAIPSGLLMRGEAGREERFDLSLLRTDRRHWRLRGHRWM